MAKFVNDLYVKNNLVVKGKAVGDFGGVDPSLIKKGTADGEVDIADGGVVAYESGDFEVGKDLEVDGKVTISGTTTCGGNLKVGDDTQSVILTSNLVQLKQTDGDTTQYHRADITFNNVEFMFPTTKTETDTFAMKSDVDTKQNTLSTAQLNACNSGITSAKVSDMATKSGTNKFTGTNEFTGTAKTDSSLTIGGTLLDTSESAGTNGQVLKSTGSGVSWTTLTDKYTMTYDSSTSTLAITSN